MKIQLKKVFLVLTNTTTTLFMSPADGFTLNLSKCESWRHFYISQQTSFYTFFHFSGNSERRVHVFLRHLEKMSHLFFESEMTPPAHFQQKRPKRPKKKISDSGRKIPFPVPGQENGIFLPLLLIREGQEMDFSSRCLKNAYFSFLYMKILFWPVLFLLALCWSLLALYWPCFGLFGLFGL